MGDEEDGSRKLTDMRMLRLKYISHSPGSCLSVTLTNQDQHIRITLIDLHEKFTSDEATFEG